MHKLISSRSNLHLEVLAGLLLRFQVVGKYIKLAGNQTAMDFFWFYFSFICL